MDMGRRIHEPSRQSSFRNTGISVLTFISFLLRARKLLHFNPSSDQVFEKSSFWHRSSSGKCTKADRRLSIGLIWSFTLTNFGVKMSEYNVPQLLLESQCRMSKGNTTHFCDCCFGVSATAVAGKGAENILVAFMGGINASHICRQT